MVRFVSVLFFVVFVMRIFGGSPNGGSGGTERVERLWKGVRVVLEGHSLRNPLVQRVAPDKVMLVVVGEKGKGLRATVKRVDKVLGRCDGSGRFLVAADGEIVEVVAAGYEPVILRAEPGGTVRRVRMRRARWKRFIAAVACSGKPHIVAAPFFVVEKESILRCSDDWRSRNYILQVFNALERRGKVPKVSLPAGRLKIAVYEGAVLAGDGGWVRVEGGGVVAAAVWVEGEFLRRFATPQGCGVQFGKPRVDVSWIRGSLWHLQNETLWQLMHRIGGVKSVTIVALDRSFLLSNWLGKGGPLATKLRDALRLIKGAGLKVGFVLGGTRQPLEKCRGDLRRHFAVLKRAKPVYVVVDRVRAADAVAFVQEVRAVFGALPLGVTLDMLHTAGPYMRSVIGYVDFVVVRCGQDISGVSRIAKGLRHLWRGGYAVFAPAAVNRNKLYNLIKEAKRLGMGVVLWGDLPDWLRKKR